MPDAWKLEVSMEVQMSLAPELPPVPARIPASVQQLLFESGLLPDWNIDLNSRACEWVENRAWVYQTSIPASWFEGGERVRLRCAGLDASGYVYLNQRLVGRFANGFVEHVFDLSAFPHQAENDCRIIFDPPPRWLGQVGYTSRITDWKARFNYTWDWQPRLVQIGIWDAVTLEVSNGAELRDMACTTTGDSLHLQGCAPAGTAVDVTLGDGGGRVIFARRLSADQLAAGTRFDSLPVERWWPRGTGAQPLYRLCCRLRGPENAPEENHDDEWTVHVGFKDVAWRACAGAPAQADPWVCEINGRAVFLQGINWTPIRPLYADVTPADYEKRIRAYVDMGCNLLRVWGGAFLEKALFYELCDRHGLLVWQEFPFSSSGLDNWPPEAAPVVAEAAEIVRSYVTRRRHHASLLCWCGGNELQGAPDGGKIGIGRPTPPDHPLFAMMRAEVARLDPGRRFIHTSSSGPRFMASAAEFGQGVHWDVHGPWSPEPDAYWAQDDALFRSEVGAAGASSLALFQRYNPGASLLPSDLSNPLWRRFLWWIQGSQFAQATGRPPESATEFVDWSQRLQAEAMHRAASACKRRFPACGGIIIWMGHDAFPCLGNTAVLDFHGDPKPAARALREVFLSEPPATHPARRASRLMENLEAGKTQTVVVYGTSLTAGGQWVLDLKNGLHDRHPGRVTVVNSGLSGQASNTALAQLEARVLAHKPDTVFIEFAINDAFAFDAGHGDHGISVEKSQSNLNQLIDAIHRSNPAAEIILQTMNPAWDAPNDNQSASRRAKLTAYYDGYRKVAAARGLPLIDHHANWSRLQTSDQARFELYIPDGVHPNAAGSTAITFPAIQAALTGNPGHASGV